MNLIALEPLMDAVRAARLPVEARIIVAVSGGSDSVALALALHALSRDPALRWSIILAHVNHSLRRDESLADEQFVRGLGQRLAVPVDCVRVDTPAYALAEHLSVESAARELRYGALREIKKRWSAEWIALGHHMNDQAETLLLHLLRGAGLTGLRGMSVRSGDLIRPLLHTSKETIRSALEDAGEQYRVDASNTALDARRNVVRHRILPELALFQPRVVPVLTRTATIVGQADDYLHGEALQTLRLLDVVSAPGSVTVRRGTFRRLHPSLRDEVLREMIRSVIGDLQNVHQSHVQEISDALASEVTQVCIRNRLPRSLAVAASAHILTISAGVSSVAHGLDEVEFSIPVDAYLSIGTLSARVVDGQAMDELLRMSTVAGPFHAVCDLDVLGTSLRIRSRRPGDRIHPAGAPGSKSLQDLFVDRSIPVDRRDAIPVLCRGDKPLWIPGVALDKSATISAGTEWVAHLSFRTL